MSFGVAAFPKLHPFGAESGMDAVCLSRTNCVMMRKRRHSGCCPVRDSRYVIVCAVARTARIDTLPFLY